MKKVILIFSLLLNIVGFSQINKAVVKDFGKVFTVENPDLLLKKDKVYKVIFDVYTDSKKNSKINSSIVTVARFLNMHKRQGVSKKNMKIALVLHGKATKNALSDAAYQNKYRKKNPNSKLLNALKKANVDIFVCGQSFASRGFSRKDLSKDVLLSLSALTALVEYQSNGYNIINFN